MVVRRLVHFCDGKFMQISRARFVCLSDCQVRSHRNGRKFRMPRVAMIIYEVFTQLFKVIEPKTNSETRKR
jgi:hypothetical protein